VPGVASPSEYVVAVGRAIAMLREERGLTQMDIWHRCDTHYNYISRIENGLADPTVLKIADIAHGMGIRPSDIFVRADELLDGTAVESG
jgi:transcriptional regulator with XRE-family HTH domain